MQKAATVTEVSDTSAPRSYHDEAGALRERVLDHLREQGFTVTNDRLITPVTGDKNKLRALHAGAVAANKEKSAGTLSRKESSFLSRLADGRSISVNAISPKLVLIEDRRSFEGLLWRWCSLHWSIPVSSGYGRRLRFLVLDEAHDNAVMGLIGLADPVFALRPRDEWIGWDAKTRGQRLTSVMDAFVLGAVPPYNALRAGKLMGLLATSSEVRDAFDLRYRNRKTTINQRDPDARLSLLTTTSALGRSSVYNRLTRPDSGLAFHPVGYTNGSGDFHFSGNIYSELADFAASVNVDGNSHAHARWKSSGPRNRREVIQRALEALGLDSRSLRVHGVRRQVFAAPLVSNAQAYLSEGAEPAWATYPADELAEYWSRRWAEPRAARDDAWRHFDRESWRLYGSC
ncbi:Druantia anti-phage system protein DruA [Streptomyces griseorubiginosus]|uniref:Druantia anti-phage system protein DruA n=1 Tax=Streptomyces griseorubiginosus TaxID=67304 RepID=UPI0033ABB49F